ncbi:MAG: hypothetical protein HZC36_02830 [Armatimonadetes bacterium]|nr:hypothetical protein [Armatimonadota bacterium]
MNELMSVILNERDRYKTLWNRTYAPLRRALTGKWGVLPEQSHSEMRFDSDGGFHFRFMDSGMNLEGRYTIVAIEGHSYIVLEAKDDQPWVLRLEEVDPWRMKLRWVDPDGPSIEVSRRAPMPAMAVA